MSKTTNITFAQLCDIADVVELVDCDGYEFAPSCHEPDSDCYGTAEYAPSCDGWMLFRKSEALEIALRDDGVTLVGQDPGGNGDMELFFRFPACFVTGFDPAEVQAPEGRAVYGRWGSSEDLRSKNVCWRHMDGWYAEAGRTAAPPSRWYPIWEAELPCALKGNPNTKLKWYISS